ncbi:hypothetical protein Rsub_08077 [Raphidocelis subcapitata]|uniref:Fungal lipase-type domain-containing protein n=1 Tax=Raphidocelis subcapitata TaxID=307507 RepID=A0A2V0P7V4_9CHLO|nr:hypothetical protein Rsub_08077 [Raphidocelis subcapitata]|eukprot:GBF95954.1 hypothetical protein Rsub_08077 [Raphidocelis subcapitata]
MSAAVRAGRRAAAHRRSHCGCAALALAALAALALLAAPRPAAAADADALAAAVGQGRAFAAAIFNETDPAAQELRSRAAGPSQEGADTVDILQICPAVKLINALPKSDNRPSGNQLLCVMIDVGERLVLALPSISCPPNKTGETGYGRQTPPPTQGRDGSAAPRPLTALAPPPDDFSGPALADVLKAEGPTYAWLWGNIQNIYAYWACSKKNGGSLDGFLMPQGWTPVGGDASDPGVVYVGTRPYMGFMEIVTGSLWAPVKAALDAEVVRGGATEIVFSGHSQGAALANILAYAAKNYLKSKGKAKQVVGAVGFATPSVGDSVFTKAFKAQVNARNLLFKNDLVRGA